MLHNMRVLAVGDHFFIISKLNKTSCFKSRHFINIYIINRTLHGRLGIRILSSRAESISHSFASLTRERYLQHSKIKFVSPRGHVISSIFLPTFPPPLIPVLVKRSAKGMHSILHHIINIGMGGGGGNILCECMSNDA